MAAKKEVLRILSAAVKVDGGKYGEVSRGEELPDNLDKGEAKRLRDAGYLCSPEDLARADAIRAGQAVDPVDTQVELGAFEATKATDDELAAYILDQKLTVDDTVALAGDDPELRARVLAAEGVASSGSPRAGVVKALEVKSAE
jgi:hypothetical protein